MENNNGKFRIELTGWKAYAVAGVTGIIAGLALVGAYALGNKIAESFE